jgi:hypothetical protein
MKAVTFTIEKIPEVRYAKNEAIKELRDVYAQILIKQCSKKLGSEDIKDEIDLKNYLILIFEKALELKLSQKELEKLESMRVKFSFLHYGTKADESIHQFLRIFTALRNGDKKAVESLVVRWPILDEQGNALSLRRGLDWEYSKALRDDVANLARECIREFLQELRDTGRVMTSAELAECRLSLTTLDIAEEDESYSNDEFESDTDTSESNTIKDASTTTDTSVAHCAAQGRAASLEVITDEEDSDKTKDIITVETENSSSHLDIALNNLLNWIYELPEWLQEQVLNSAPIKLLIESAEQQAAIYNKNTVANLFAKLLSTDIANNSADAVEDNINAKATVADTSFSESIDTSMILNEPTVTGWILPTVIGSGDLFANHAFNGLLQPNGLNGIDIF